MRGARFSQLEQKEIKSRIASFNKDQGYDGRRGTPIVTRVGHWHSVYGIFYYTAVPGSYLSTIEPAGNVFDLTYVPCHMSKKHAIFQSVFMMRLLEQKFGEYRHIPHNPCMFSKYFRPLFLSVDDRNHPRPMQYY